MLASMEPIGWTEAELRPRSDTQFAFLKNCGLLFDPVIADHYTLIGWLLPWRGRVSTRAAGGAFLASLGARRLDLRAAIASHALLAHFPDHRLSENRHAIVPSGSIWCRVCDFIQTGDALPLNAMNFERCKWGGVRHEFADFAWFAYSTRIWPPVP